MRPLAIEPQSESKDELVEGLAGSKAASFRKVVEELSLAERRAVCRALELPGAARVVAVPAKHPRLHAIEVVFASGC